MSRHPYKRNGYYNSKYAILDNYLDSMAEYVQRDVHPDDKKKVFAAAQPSYIRNQLKKSQSFSLMFRDISEGVEKTYRMLLIQGTDEIVAEQARLRAIEEASKANEASMMKSRFVQNISHDIRTPLNAIVGYSKLLGMPDGVLSSDEKTEFAEYINDSADMLTMLIDDVLSISDIENGILKVQISEIYPNNVCMKAINCSKMRVLPNVKL